MSKAYVIDRSGRVEKINSPLMLDARVEIAEYQQVYKATMDAKGSKKLREKYGTVIGGVLCATRPFDFATFAYAATVNTYHSSAIDVKAQDVVGRGWKITGDSDSDKKELTDFFQGAFRGKTFAEGMACVWTDREAVGNGYIEIVPGVDGKPAEMTHLPAGEMWIRLDELGFVQQKNGQFAHFKSFDADEARIAGLPNTDPLRAEETPNEVIHFARYSPWSPFYGIPCILGAWNALVLAQLVAEYNLAFFNNNAIPEYVVLLEGDATEDTVTTIQRYFREHLKGQHHKTLVLESPQGAKITFQKVTSDAAKEAAFRLLRVDCRDEIIHAHRVPPQKVGIVETGKLGGNLSTEQAQEYKDSIVGPNQRNVAARFDRLISERFEMQAQFQLEPYDVDTRLQESKIDQVYLNAKVLVPNEVRAKRYPDLEPLEGGDVPLGPPTMADIAAVDETLQGIQGEVRQAIARVEGGRK